jgi:hypothetical protein
MAMTLGFIFVNLSLWYIFNISMTKSWICHHQQRWW